MIQTVLTASTVTKVFANKSTSVLIRIDAALIRSITSAKSARHVSQANVSVSRLVRAQKSATKIAAQGIYATTSVAYHSMSTRNTVRVRTRSVAREKYVYRAYAHLASHETIRDKSWDAVGFLVLDQTLFPSVAQGQLLVLVTLQVNKAARTTLFQVLLLFLFLVSLKLRLINLELCLSMEKLDQLLFQDSQEPHHYQDSQELPHCPVCPAPLLNLDSLEQLQSLDSRDIKVLVVHRLVPMGLCLALVKEQTVVMAATSMVGKARSLRPTLQAQLLPTNRLRISLQVPVNLDHLFLVVSIQFLPLEMEITLEDQATATATASLHQIRPPRVPMATSPREAIPLSHPVVISQTPRHLASHLQEAMGTTRLEATRAPQRCQSSHRQEAMEAYHQAATSHLLEEMEIINHHREEQAMVAALQVLISHRQEVMATYPQAVASLQP
jgi:hypothetical protein